jgi:G3E family GTPase
MQDDEGLTGQETAAANDNAILVAAVSAAVEAHKSSTLGHAGVSSHNSAHEHGEHDGHSHSHGHGHGHGHGHTHGDTNSLSKYATLDTMVTVVDALNIFDVLSSLDTLADENNSVGMIGNENEDDRSICQLMLDQIEFADVIVLSKIKLFKAGEEKLQEIKTLIQKLNPRARVLLPREDKYGGMDVRTELLNTGLFDMEKASTSAGWLQELAAPEHTPETEEYGISSTIFRANNMPFHPMRLKSILNGFGNYSSAVEMSSGIADQGHTAPFRGVVRAKGKLWLANANTFPTMNEPIQYSAEVNV